MNTENILHMKITVKHNCMFVYYTLLVPCKAVEIIES